MPSLLTQTHQGLQLISHRQAFSENSACPKSHTRCPDLDNVPALLPRPLLSQLRFEPSIASRTGRSDASQTLTTSRTMAVAS
jgi:hypothetical protein